MYAAKSVLCWIVILCCWQETQAKPAISMPNRTRVALAGESLIFSLSVVIPANYTTSKLACYTQNKTIIWHEIIRSKLFETKQLVSASIKMHNSSSSGNYYFSYAKQEVHWVVHVRDKGYEEPPKELDSAVITMLALSGILLIFSVSGSLYILKSYKKQPSCSDDKNVAEQRPEESEDVILDEDTVSASLYTSLQYRSSSIYDTLHPDTMHEENTKKKKSDKKHCIAQEDEVFDSVYENL
ncbi:NFAT activation molecule 1 [Garra rufa]|uniref:NFAT activation molecule 1 n=1 Tax=Garra rufa TaxID=137080 RepID=UPI003CCE69D0